MQPFLKAKSDVLVEPAPTLMTSVHIKTVDESERAGLFDVLEYKDMEEIGFYLTSETTNILGKQGFQVYFDKEQAQKLSLTVETLADDEKSQTVVLGSLWNSKDTSLITIDNNTKLIESFRNRLVDVLNTEKEDEHFLFVVARLSEVERYFVMRNVQFIVDYVILNETGSVVFRARGVGDGIQSFLFADKSKKSLNIAIEKAIRSIERETKREL